MISSVAWVRKGVAKQTPDTYEEDPFEHPLRKNQENETKQENPDDKYDMEHYDDDDDLPFLSGAVEGLMLHRNQDEDPYIAVPPRDSVQDMEDFMINKDDMLLLAAVSEEDDVSHLDVYVYESVENNIFVHHDYLLPSFPLALAWLDFPVGGTELSGDKQKTNIVAVASFEPYIELWDLDFVNHPAPIALLGGPENPEDMENVSSKNVKLVPGSHRDSVLGLSWNKFQRNLLASASADCTSKLWDLMTGRCVKTYEYKDKVQSVLWNPSEPSVLATGCFGGSIVITDVRSASNVALTTTLPSDVESMAWLPSPHHNHVLVGTETGNVVCFDMLKDMSKPMWTLQAHTKATQALAVSPGVVGLIATGSLEKASPLKLWDISSGAPTCLYSKTEDLGSVFSVSFAEDSPFLLAIGTKNSKPMLIDTLDFAVVQQKYQNWQPTQQTTQTTTDQSFNIPPPVPTPTPKNEEDKPTKPVGTNKKKKNRRRHKK